MKTDNSSNSMVFQKYAMLKYRIDPSDPGSDLVDEFIAIYRCPVTGREEQRHIAFRSELNPVGGY